MGGEDGDNGVAPDCGGVGGTLAGVEEVVTDGRGTVVYFGKRPVKQMQPVSSRSTMLCKME